MSTGFLSDTAIHIIAEISATIITAGVPLLLAKLNKIQKVYTTLFGIDDVDNVQGLVTVVEDNNDMVEEHDDDLEHMQAHIDRLQRRIDDLTYEREAEDEVN